MIFTVKTWPTVSNICLSTSSVTRGSKPPTYNDRLFGSGAALRRKPPALPGDMTPCPLFIGEEIAVGIGLVFCGMFNGGGTWAPPGLLVSYPGAPDVAEGGLPSPGAGILSAMVAEEQYLTTGTASRDLREAQYDEGNLESWDGGDAAKQ
jgi:hypothetical protein